MAFQIRQSVPLTFRKILNGAPVTGLSVTVTVYNDATNATLLAATAMTETTGVYRYTWSGATVFTSCRATYTESGNQWDEYFTIEDEEDLVENRTGRSV